MMMNLNYGSNTQIQLKTGRLEDIETSSSQSPMSSISDALTVKSGQKDRLEVIKKLKKYDENNYGFYASPSKSIGLTHQDHNVLLRTRKIDFLQEDDEENTISTIKVDLNYKTKNQKNKNKHIEPENIFVKTQKTQCVLALNSQWRGTYAKNNQTTPIDLKKLLKQRRVCQSYGKFTEQQFYGTFDYYKQINESKEIKGVQTLYLSWMKIPNVVNVLNRRIFVNLKTLNIGGNNIQSLESLTNLKADRLQELWCWNNQIVETKSLRKCSFKNMKVLDMNTNKIKETPFMKELLSKKLKRINLDSNQCISIDGFINLLSSSPEASISVMFAKFPMALGRPAKRRRKQISTIKVPTMNVCYS